MNTFFVHLHTTGTGLDASTTKYLLMTPSVAIALQHVGTDNFHYWCSQVRSDQEMPVLQSTVAASQQLFVLCLSSICFASVNGLSGKEGLMDQAEAYGSGKRRKNHRYLG